MSLPRHDDRENRPDRTHVRLRSYVAGITFSILSVVCWSVAAWVIVSEERSRQVKHDMAVSDANQWQMAAARAGEEFMDQLREGKVDAAYRSTSNRYQQRVKMDELQSLVDTHPEA